VSRGIEVIIVGAGSAAHLAGVIAAETPLPVIGIPIDSSPLKGIDALLSTVQMPAGVPVATMAIGKAGARNAAVLAVQILALKDTGLRKKLNAFRNGLAEQVEQKSLELQKKLNQRL
jgi:phosphoribosylaminoimidazole carboxylase PurE protein